MTIIIYNCCNDTLSPFISFAVYKETDNIQALLFPE